MSFARSLTVLATACAMLLTACSRGTDSGGEEAPPVTADGGLDGGGGGLTKSNFLQVGMGLYSAKDELMIIALYLYLQRADIRVNHLLGVDARGDEETLPLTLGKFIAGVEAEGSKISDQEWANLKKTREYSAQEPSPYRLTQAGELSGLYDWNVKSQLIALVPQPYYRGLYKIIQGTPIEERKDAACDFIPALGEHESRAGSVAKLELYTPICISRLELEKASMTAAATEVTGLVGHELAHTLGMSEPEAEQMQVLFTSYRDKTPGLSLKVNAVKAAAIEFRDALINLKSALVELHKIARPKGPIAPRCFAWSQVEIAWAQVFSTGKTFARIYESSNGDLGGIAEEVSFEFALAGRDLASRLDDVAQLLLDERAPFESCRHGIRDNTGLWPKENYPSWIEPGLMPTLSYLQENAERVISLTAAQDPLTVEGLQSYDFFPGNRYQFE